MGRRAAAVVVGWGLAFAIGCSQGATAVDGPVTFGPGTADPSESSGGLDTGDSSTGALDTGGVATSDVDTTSTGAAITTETTGDSGDDEPMPTDTTGEEPPAEPVCGDGVVEGGELCDDGNASDSDGCTTTCTVTSCGDGALQDSEQCDDGNASNTDACLATCVVASCGDGFVRQGVEQCDDGNASNVDACVDQCTLASCGDGYVHAGVEECDGAGDPMVYACSLQCQDQQVWYQWSFSQGYWPNPMACSDFDQWRAALADDHTSIHIAGTFDVNGRTCTGPAATTLCNALHDGTSVSIGCDGSTWRVGNDCAGAIEVTVDGTDCNCANPGVALRPCVSLVDWGGVGTSTCSGPSQEIYIECGFE